MTKSIKFTDEETKKINDLRVEASQIFIQLGQVVLEREKRIKELDAVEAQLRDKHAELEISEQDLFKELNTKYGNGTYNPDTGEFFPTEEPASEK